MELDLEPEEITPEAEEFGLESDEKSRNWTWILK